MSGQGSYGEAAVNVSINGVDQGLFRNQQSLTSAGSDWQTMSFNYVATTTSTRLPDHQCPGHGLQLPGHGLDNVSLSYVSGPPVAGHSAGTANVCLDAGGLGVMGALRRSRRPTV